MKKNKCYFRWDTTDPTYLAKGVKRKDEVMHHECLRFENHENDHVCYCGQDLKREVQKQTMPLPMFT